MARAAAEAEGAMFGRPGFPRGPELLIATLKDPAILKNANMRELAESSLVWADTSQSFAKEIPDKRERNRALASACTNYGYVLLETQNLQHGYHYLKRALAHAKDAGEDTQTGADRQHEEICRLVEMMARIEETARQHVVNLDDFVSIQNTTG